MNIDNLKATVDLMAALYKAEQTVMEDGKVDWKDSITVLSMMPTVGSFISKADEIPAEVKDLSTEEAGELVMYTMAKFNVENEKAYAIAEGAIKVASALYAMYISMKTPK